MKALITGNGPLNGGPEDEMRHGFSDGQYVEIIDTIERLNVAKCKDATLGVTHPYEYWVELHHLRIFGEYED